jgi:hypothetical protein
VSERWCSSGSVALFDGATWRLWVTCPENTTLFPAPGDIDVSHRPRLLPVLRSQHQAELLAMLLLHPDEEYTMW